MHAKITKLLTNLVVRLEGNVHLQNVKHELEPRAHLIGKMWCMNGEHNVIGFYLPAHCFVKVPDFFTWIGPPGQMPLGAILPHIYTFVCQIGHSCGGTRSCEEKTPRYMVISSDRQEVMQANDSLTKSAGTSCSVQRGRDAKRVGCSHYIPGALITAPLMLGYKFSGLFYLRGRKRSVTLGQPLLA